MKGLQKQGKVLVNAQAEELKLTILALFTDCLTNIIREAFTTDFLQELSQQEVELLLAAVSHVSPALFSGDMRTVMMTLQQELSKRSRQ